MKARTLITSFSTTLIVAGLAAVWAVASPLSAGCASATPLDQIVAAPSENSQFVSHINQLRRSQGLNELSVEGNLTSVAQAWAVNMAVNDGIFHRSDLRSGLIIDWKRLGENVGMGPAVGDLMQAFIESPGHYKNLVDPTFTHIGVGTVRSPDGLLYTAHEFAAIAGGAVAPRVTAAPQPTVPRVTTPLVTTPRVTTPRVTAPRSTTPPPPTTTTTTEPATIVERSAAQQHELQDGGADDHDEQQDKNKGRCRAHGPLRLVA